MEIVYALALIFAAILAGAIVRAVQPFLAERQAQEKTLQELRWIPEEDLTKEQKQFMKVLNEPIHWLKYYTFSAIGGFIGVLALAMGTFIIAAQTLPEQPADAFVFGQMAINFLAAMGGVDAVNRAQKSSSITKDAGKIAMVQAIKTT